MKYNRRCYQGPVRTVFILTVFFIINISAQEVELTELDTVRIERFAYIVNEAIHPFTMDDLEKMVTKMKNGGKMFSNLEETRARIHKYGAEPVEVTLSGYKVNGEDVLIQITNVHYCLSGEEDCTDEDLSFIKFTEHSLKSSKIPFAKVVVGYQKGEALFDTSLDIGQSNSEDILIDKSLITKNNDSGNWSGIFVWQNGKWYKEVNPLR